MTRRILVLIVTALTLVAVGCAKKAAFAPPPMPMVSVFAGAPQRYIAQRDKLDVITQESELQKSWESAIAFCSTIQCEVMSSSITTRTADSTPSGTMALRIVPEDFNKFLTHIEKLGRVAQHTTEREDKTTAVVDTEAKIKNLTTFRDNLRAMLAKPSATVKDLVEIQRQLTDTQSELDSETAQRKILANETEKIALEVSFHVERRKGGAGAFAEIWDALRESGSTLGDSTASLITTIVAVVPWLIVVVPVAWLLAKAWRRLRSRRNQPPTLPSPPSTA